MIGRVGFLGAGNMSTALIGGLLHSRFVPVDQMIASDVLVDRLERLRVAHGVRGTRENRVLARESDVIVLAVKPQVTDDVLLEISNDIRPDHLIITVASGIPVEAVEGRLPIGARVVRAMPNTPASVRAGMTALAGGTCVDQDDLRIASQLFEAVGSVLVVDNADFDAVTGLSGCGPAYMMMFIEALADGGVKVGLRREVALKLAAETMLGSARLLLETGDHPARIRDMVASPGGATIAGLHALEGGAVRKALIDAVEAATKRAAELGERGARRASGSTDFRAPLESGLAPRVASDYPTEPLRLQAGS